MATQDQPRANDAHRLRYEEALRSFVDKVQQDRYIVAAILFGSLAYDDVWEKSDVDILLVSRDDRAAERSYSLVEDNINFHVNIGPRGKFKEQIERALQGSFMHSVMTRSTLLFSTDETIQEYYQHVHHVGSRDREMQMLNAAARVIPMLTKAEKWLVVKRDPIYSFHWFIYLIDSLATIEVLWHADVPGREVVQQALTYNPDFFKPLYTDLIQRPKDAETMRQAIQMVHNYLDERCDVLFKPILRYLAAAGSVRSASEIEEHLRQRTGNGYLALACEWLADKGILRKVSVPLRLTEKSRVTLDEAAYYYDGGDIHNAD